MVRSYFVCVVIALISTACGSAQEHEHGSVADGVESSFAAFTRVVYEELDRRPFDEAYDLELGLFGDMNVLAGESIVMGRYRYLVHSGVDRPEGHMAFFVRDAGSEAVASVTLAFVSGGGGWALHEAGYRSVFESDGPPSSFHLSLDTHFDSWVASAVQRAHSVSHVH